MDQNQVKALIQQALPDATIEIGGEGCSLSATVTSQAFVGLARVKQHRLVMDSVRALLDSGELHALALNTSTPKDDAQPSR